METEESKISVNAIENYESSEPLFLEEETQIGEDNTSAVTSDFDVSKSFVEDNSDPDFEEILDDAIEVTDSSPIDLVNSFSPIDAACAISNSYNENDQCQSLRLQSNTTLIEELNIIPDTLSGKLESLRVIEATKDEKKDPSNIVKSACSKVADDDNNNSKKKILKMIEVDILTVDHQKTSNAKETESDDVWEIEKFLKENGPTTVKNVRVDLIKIEHKDASTVCEKSSVYNKDTRKPEEDVNEMFSLSNKNEKSASTAPVFANRGSSSRFQKSFEECIRSSSELAEKTPKTELAKKTPKTELAKKTPKTELDKKTPKTELDKKELYMKDPDSFGSSMGDVKIDLSENNDSAGSWKIDYIRVESEDPLPPPGKNRKKIPKKKTKKVKDQTSAPVKKQANAKKDIINVSKEKVLYPNNIRIAYKFNEPEASERKMEAFVPDWNTVFTSNGCSQHAFHNKILVEQAQPPRVPKLTKYASPDLLEHLQDKDLETDPCPGCGDSFLLPATFFQHVYRKSVMINFNCKPCNKLFTFTNKCLLRMHTLSHLEDNKELFISMEDIDILSLNMSELKSKDENYFHQHRKIVKEMKSESLSRCMECLSSFSRPQLVKHLISPQTIIDSSLYCDICNNYFPSSCSFTSHKRIHRKLPPYVCPECSEEFCTWSIFKVHISRSCHHDTKTLIYTCAMCPETSTPALSSAISHVIDTHTKLFYQCSQCCKAFSTIARLEDHCTSQHKDRNIPHKTLYKSPVNKCVFFQNRDKFEKHLELEYEFPVVFGYRCNGCHIVLQNKQTFEDHSAACSHNFCGSQLYNDKPVEDKYVGVLDDLRRAGEDLQCKGCLKHGKNFRNHIDKHHTEKIESFQIVETKVAEPSPHLTSNFENARQTRNMKRTQEDVSAAAKKRKLDISPLKMKIKIVSDTDKVDKPPANQPTQIKVETPSVPSASSKNKGKVKFSEPSRLVPLISTLGIDVPRAHELIEMNHLANPDAFVQGSTLTTSSENLCLVCGLRPNTKTAFLEHIKLHNNDPAAFQCKECGASFASEPSWKKHLLVLHRIRKVTPDMYCRDLHQSIMEGQDWDPDGEVGEVGGDSDGDDGDDGGAVDGDGGDVGGAVDHADDGGYKGGAVDDDVGCGDVGGAIDHADDGGYIGGAVDDDGGEEAIDHDDSDSESGRLIIDTGE